MRKNIGMGLGSWLRSVSLTVAVTVAVAGFALADGDGDHDGDADGKHRHEAADRASRGAETGELVPLATIVADVRKRYTGEIVGTEFEEQGGRPTYEFHLLAEDGRVTEVRVDATNGRFLAGGADDD
jgi:uncharacterized membrane protein YkoI